MTVDGSRLARMYLLHAAVPGALATYDFVVAHGVDEAAKRIAAGAVPDTVRREIIRPNPRLACDLHALDTGAARLVTPEDDEWPHGQLRDMQRSQLGAPLALWVRGTARLADVVDRSICVTGSNAPSQDGADAAAEFAAHAAQHAVTVLGGGSYGVEGAAHRAAVASGRTLVVLPGGVDLAHPLNHRDLFDDIVDRGGLLVSEYPIGAPPTAYRRALRYRLLAALSDATLIAETGPTGRAMHTAFAARLLRRPIYVVDRGSVSARTTGGHTLIHTGDALGVRSVDEIALFSDHH